MNAGSPLPLLDMVNNGFMFPLLPSMPINCKSSRKYGKGDCYFYLASSGAVSFLLMAL